MRQFFALPQLQVGDRYRFEDEQAHHISHVLRMKSGDEVRIVTHGGQAFKAVLAYEDGEVWADIVSESEQLPERDITVAAAMIKKEKWELLIQKACELGASRIVPLETARTIIHLDSKDVGKKLERWNKIALEACQQCNRTSICEVTAPVKLKEVVGYRQPVSFVAYESENEHLLRDVINEDGAVCFVIGPEGGFEAAEIDWLVSQGFETVTLGPRILRAETAAMFVLSAIEALR